MIESPLAKALYMTAKSPSDYRVFKSSTQNTIILKNTNLNTKTKSYDAEGNLNYTLLQPHGKNSMVFTNPKGDVFLRYEKQNDTPRKDITYEKTKIKSLSEFINYIKSKANLIYQ